MIQVLTQQQGVGFYSIAAVSLKTIVSIDLAVLPASPICRHIHTLKNIPDTGPAPCNNGNV